MKRQVVGIREIRLEGNSELNREFLHFMPQSLLDSSELFFPYQTKKGVKSRVIENVNDVLWIMR